jgi:hypothetical protein
VDWGAGTMAWLWPRTLLKWREPPEAQRARQSISRQYYLKIRNRLFLLMLGAITLLLLVKWLNIWLGLPGPPPAELVLRGFGLLAFAAFAIYLLPYLARNPENGSDSHVSISDSGISSSRSFRPINYRSIRRCQIIQHQTDRATLNLLVITYVPVRNREVTTIFGIDTAVQLPRLTELLESRGVSVESD